MGDPLRGVGSGIGFLLIGLLGGSKENVNKVGQGWYTGGRGSSKSSGGW